MGRETSADRRGGQDDSQAGPPPSKQFTGPAAQPPRSVGPLAALESARAFGRPAQGVPLPCRSPPRWLTIITMQPVSRSAMPDMAPHARTLGPLITSPKTT
jgi:hypothetical protein